MFGIGSANAATIMDLLSSIHPKAVLFLGKCGGLKKKNNVGDLILPIAAIRGEGTSDDYMPSEVPALPAFSLQKAISTTIRDFKKDYWTGTVSLVIFATAEIILFAWIFGVDKGWKEINRGADIKVPHFYKFVIKWITPIFILTIFISALIKPLNGEAADWQTAIHQLFTQGTWPWANDSIIGQIIHVNEKVIWFIDGVPTLMFFKDMSRLLLVLTFAGLSYLVHLASKKRKSLSKTSKA
jgi:hypothetical protein